MADFTPNTTTRSAIRKLAAPLADVTAFDNLVQGVITSNPFQCVGYPYGGVNHPPIERTRQGYTSRIVYQDGNAKTTAIISVRASTIGGFTTVANLLLADAAIASALGGTPVRDFGGEKYTSTLKCHDANGEDYYLNFSREQVTLTSFTADAIQTRVETWADTVGALA